MTRRIYHFLVQLHPAEFRNRFGDEMELMYEEAGKICGNTALVLDAATSLGRQWFFRPTAWKWAAATLGGAISLFFGFGGFLTWRGIWEALRACF